MTRPSQSNETGFYLISNLPIGPYEVSAEAPGFKKWVATGVGLTVNSKLAVNAKLEVGNITDSVTVATDAVQVETFNRRSGASFLDVRPGDRRHRPAHDGVSAAVQLLSDPDEPGRVLKTTRVTLRGPFVDDTVEVCAVIPIRSARHSRVVLNTTTVRLGNAARPT